MVALAHEQGNQLDEALSSVLLAEQPNFRDLGGVPAGPGREFRRGVVYRAQALTGLSDEATSALRSLGLSHVVDLRMERERRELPVALPPHMTVVVADVMADLADNGAVAAGSAMSSNDDDATVKVERAAPAGGRDMMLETYRNFVRLPSAKAGYGAFVRCVIEADGATAVYCAAGKDRTGWAAAFLQAFVGVDEDTVIAAYTQSNRNLVGRYTGRIQEVRDSGGDVEAFLAVVDAHPDYLGAAFEFMGSEYGDVEGYLIKGLGLSERDLAALERRLVA
ncbi:MAG: tyrosine-protein phosphatase [Candidatus Nanopelagicales bacterium]